MYSDHNSPIFPEIIIQMFRDQQTIYVLTNKGNIYKEDSIYDSENNEYINCWRLQHTSNFGEFEKISENNKKLEKKIANKNKKLTYGDIPF